MNKEMIERWLTFKAKDEKEAFKKIMLYLPKLENSKSDIRGFPFGRDDSRIDLKHHKFTNADFSFSYFRNCNIFNMEFVDCTFMDCDFSEIRLWNTVFKKCIFIKSNFQNATLGMECKYIDCTFEHSKLKGKYFSFGKHTLFDFCVFNNCHIQSAEPLSIEFRSCEFTSKLISVRFKGKIFSDIEKQFSDKNAFPTKIHDCNFENCSFDRVEIFEDIDCRNTKFPDVSFRQLENSKYYERNPTTAST
jgi:uncharacterized protein YjbI with pentapeptide repeats